MRRLLVRGNAQLGGQVFVRGSKSAVPDLLATALLTSGTTAISNASFVGDVGVMREFLVAAGCEVSVDETRGRIKVDASTVRAPEDDVFAEFHHRSRKPILGCAPLLARLGKAVITDPGGCPIGTRPTDMHLEVLAELGASVTVTPRRIELSLPSGRFRGARVKLRYPSVGATEQFLLAASMAEGDSELENAAIEPEILNVVDMLQRMGAIVMRGSERVFRVIGVSRLAGAAVEAVPDRLEAASWASLALATAGRIVVRGVRQQDLATFLNYYRLAGGEYSFSSSGRDATFWREGERLRPLSVETDVHPGFMTDWQPPFITAMSQANGSTVLHETVFEDRLGYTRDLRRMGARVETFPECLGRVPCRFVGQNHHHSAVVVGPSRLWGIELRVPDLRAGFAYIIAALIADGETVLSASELLDRGYENIWEKLGRLGAQIEEV